MRNLLYLFILIGMTFLTDCGKQRSAIGASDQIYVVASAEIRDQIGDLIDTTFCYGLRVPEFQRFFEIAWQPLENFPKVIQYKNIILIADLSKPDLANKIVRRLLPKAQIEQALQDSGSVLAVEDNWAKGQLLVIILGTNLRQIQKSIITQRDWLYQKFDQKYLEVQTRYWYQTKEQTRLSEYLMKKYRWTIRVQHDYVVLKELPEENFVWLGRGIPYRWLAVNWTDGIRTEWLTPNGLFERREFIGTKFYQGIRTEKKFLGHNFTRLGENDALRMYGLWYHAEKTQGGPFITYAFYDKRTDRTFIIDLLMYGPGEKISFLFRGVDIMARTFTTAAS